MDFSSDILIQFGLNLAGYLVAGLLVYTMAARLRKVITPSIRTGGSVAAADRIDHADKTVPSTPVKSTNPEFIPLAEHNSDPASAPPDSGMNAEGAAAEGTRSERRRANRRAIYREAKRLLAKGKSRGELMHQLPLTEDEMEMLSAAGNA